MKKTKLKKIKPNSKKEIQREFDKGFDFSRAKKTIISHEVEPRDFFKNQTALVTALSEALLDGDIDAFQEIIMEYLSIINKEELARISKLPIATIRRVAAGSNYNIETLLKITAAIKKAA